MVYVIFYLSCTIRTRCTSGGFFLTVKQIRCEIKSNFTTTQCFHCFFLLFFRNHILSYPRVRPLRTPHPRLVTTSCIRHFSISITRCQNRRAAGRISDTHIIKIAKRDVWGNHDKTVVRATGRPAPPHTYNKKRQRGRLTFNISF